MKRSFVVPLFEKIAHEMGITIHVEEEYGYVGQITLPDGRKRYFRNTHLDLNTSGATEIALDKGYSSYFMDRMGYPVPKGETFFSEEYAELFKSAKSIDAACEYASRLIYPVIVKPNSGREGRGVVRAYNEKELREGIAQIVERNSIFLVQEVVRGTDYRICILDDEVVLAYARSPLSVTGDGDSTIEELLTEKQNIAEARGRSSFVSIDDFRLVHQLEHLGLSPDFVPEPDQRIELLPTSNLSTGGDAIDVTEDIHNEWKKLSVALARDMGLRFCGIDVIADQSLSEPPRSFSILELNATPGFRSFASLGEDQHRRVEELYRKAFSAMLE